MDADGWISWISLKSQPAGKWCDQRQWKEILPQILPLINNEDIFCMDGGYKEPTELISRCVIPHKKPRNGDLTFLI